MIKPEILAPAGTEEQLCAAVRTGADGVYMGYGSFNARAGAENISAESLKSAVMYCHERNVRLYVAMNTLVKDCELGDALYAAEDICQSGADGVIVQDLGAAKIFKDCAPHMPLHASTQMTVHTPSGAELLHNLGFKRVVLAREMSGAEIEQVVKSCNIETEVFVHGAHCMSVSGQCYLSSVLGGRSGNRGLCAQPCRLPFCSKDLKGERTGTGHDLSLKDMSLVSHIEQLSKIGVTSLKIEGRLKRPEYIAAAVTVCRMAADGEPIPDGLFEKLEAVFSRSGFTDGYFTAKRGKAMFGYRRKDDVTAATGEVFSSLRQLYKDERAKVSVDFSLRAYTGEPLTLSVKDGVNAVTVSGDIVEKMKTAPTDREKLCSQLKKTGGTPYFAGDISADLGGDIFVPASGINGLRREALSALSEKRRRISAVSFDKTGLAEPKEHISNNSPGLRACFYDIKNIPLNADRCEIVFVPISAVKNAEDIKALQDKGLNLGVTVTGGMFGREEHISELLCKAGELSVNHMLAGNLGALPLAKKAGLTAHCSFRLNAANSYSLEYLKELGAADTEISFELTAGQISKAQGGIKRGAVVYGKLPLMLTRNCPAANSGVPCGECRGRGKIIDRKGKDFEVICDGICSQLLNPVPLCVFDRLSDFRGIDFYSLFFTTETAFEAQKTIEAFFARKNPFKPSTTGLYVKGIQ